MVDDLFDWILAAIAVGGIVYAINKWYGKLVMIISDWLHGKPETKIKRVIIKTMESLNNAIYMGRKTIKVLLRVEDGSGQILNIREEELPPEFLKEAYPQLIRGNQASHVYEELLTYTQAQQA